MSPSAWRSYTAPNATDDERHAYVESGRSTHRASMAQVQQSPFGGTSGDCICAYEQQKLCLREFLSNSTSKVSLTADTWTSNQTLGYLCITCHFIDSKWKLHKRIIRFSLVETPHDHKNMFNAMLKSLHEWQIEDKLFGVSLDNATVNDTFIHLLRDNLIEKHLLPCRGDFFHNRCAAHVLNLIVQEGFKAVTAATSRIRESVKYVKCSQARKQRFEEMIKQEGIPSMKRPKLDVSTRWNSTYDMLVSALIYRRAFRALTREDNQYVFEPVLAEWKMADKLCSILKVFYQATKKVSGSKYPTANLYFHQLWQVQKVLERESMNTTPAISSMVHSMREKLRKYWNLSYLQICIPVIFDPRFKLKFLEFRLSSGFGNIAPGYLTVVRTKMRELFAEYSSHMNSSAQNDQASENVEFQVDDDNADNPWADWGQHVSLELRNKANELDMYLEEEIAPATTDFDILQYWRTYSKIYPTLACIARDLLAVPASTVASESAFSTGERVISDYRSRLASETVEALICLQDWIRAEDNCEIEDITSDDDL